MKETVVFIRATRKRKSEELTMIAEVPRTQSLIKSRKLKMGWTQCGIRERVDITRCFRCLNFGYKTWECTSQIDRSKDFIKCGEAAKTA